MAIFKSNCRFMIFAGALFGLRLWLGRLTGCSFDPNLYHDDMLLINYADLHAHFVTQDLPQKDLLAKVMGYPLVLYLVKISGLIYTDAISILWTLAALSTVALMRVLRGEKNLPLDLAIFAFVLFTPMGFDSGPKIYRSGILPPLYFIVLTMLAILFARHFLKPQIKISRLLAFNVILGVAFTLTYYVKEDGLWLLMCLVAVTVICLGKKFFSGGQRLRHAMILLVPLMIFAGGTTAYKFVNQKYFGVYLINNRTEGELAEFLKLIYKIKSDERTASVWAPADAIVKAFDASETLRQAPTLREAVVHTHWFGGDIVANPIRGEFLGWVMLSALYDSGTCKTPADQEKFLHEVNAELKTAFDAGTLPRDDRISFLPLMGSMTAEEIFSLREVMLTAYKAHLTLYSYLPGALPLDFAPYAKKFGLSTNPADYGIENFIIKQATEPSEALDKAAALTNINFAEVNPHADEANRIIEKIFSVYSVIQCVLFAAAIFGVVGSLVAIVQRKKIFSLSENLMLTIALAALILSACYAFAVAWFCAFIRDTTVFWFGFAKGYATALIPFLMTFEILGAYLLCHLYKSGRGRQ